MKIDFVHASEDDTDDLIAVQNAAFADDVRKYGECPAYVEDREVMLGNIRSKIFYKILADGVIIGSIEVCRRTDSHYYLRVLSVHPDYHNRGIGSMALQFIFDEHPEATLWTLITPKDNKRNCHLYEKAGFYCVKDIVQSDVLTLSCYRKGDKPMNILVVNGSPRGAQGNTEVLVKAFLQGAHDAGAEFETIYLKDKKINHCIGCFDCWFKTPGICVFKDDMPELMAKVPKADMVVCAVPLYIYTVTGLMKDFMDRLLPLAQPFIDLRDGMSTHPSRDNNAALKSFVLISNCGFPEPEHFLGLKETIRCWFRGDDHTIAGMICCAGGSVLQVPELQDGIKWYIDAARQAGREVVENGRIADDTQSTLDQPLIKDQKLFADMANAQFSSMGIERIGERQSVNNQTSVSSAVALTAPTTLETTSDLVAGIATYFNKDAAGDMQVVVQFVVTDEEPGRYFIEIKNGDCIAYAGEHPSPSITVTTPADVWFKIAHGKLNGAMAFMTGKYKVSGDMSLLMKFDKLFPGIR
ncbi:MAG: GNAT family N-acetyltransferase [Armatimonadota bacterium]|nr:GNAT family N-acetyltransferase [bacterium]